MAIAGPLRWLSAVDFCGSGCAGQADRGTRVHDFVPVK